MLYYTRQIKNLPMLPSKSKRTYQRLVRSCHLNHDKTFYRNPDTKPPFGFVLLFLDAGGFANLIDGALLVAHELSVLFNLAT